MDGEIDAGFPRTGYVHRYQWAPICPAIRGRTGTPDVPVRGVRYAFPAPGKRITDY